MFKFLLIVLFFATPAFAIDPECVDAAAADHNVPYNAMQGIRFCASSVDIDGVALLPEEITECSIIVVNDENGTSHASTFASTPGQYHVIPVQSTWPKNGTLNAFCTGEVGSSDSTPVYNAKFRRTRLSSPKVVR